VNQYQVVSFSIWLILLSILFLDLSQKCTSLSGGLNVTFSKLVRKIFTVKILLKFR